MIAPEERARQTIDVKLAESGWIVQSRDEVNLAAGPGIMVRDLKGWSQKATTSTVRTL